VAVNHDLVQKRQSKSIKLFAVAFIGLALSACSSTQTNIEPPPTVQPIPPNDGYGYVNEGEIDRLKQQAYEEDLVSRCIDENSSTGYADSSLENYCQDNMDDYAPDPEPPAEYYNYD